jgi:hypothetical protein
MAGNIPAVGFHDYLSVLISGHRLKAKLSSQDSFLINYLHQRLITIEPRFQDRVEFAEHLDGVDAVIATGSDNTARYFEYYFQTVPQIIRKNRSSCAVLSGDESVENLSDLGTDVFSYFGLGCRNVSKLYVPGDFNFSNLFQAWQTYQPVIRHTKYANNYTYQKSILQINQTPFQDPGFILLKEDPGFVSPISVLYLEYYSDRDDLQQKIKTHQHKIQCIVSAETDKDGVAFGQAQFPDVADYADQVDTMKFLSGF